jgi:hypothetical protein
VKSSRHPDNGIFPGIRSLFGTDEFWSARMGLGLQVNALLPLLTGDSSTPVSSRSI